MEPLVGGGRAGCNRPAHRLRHRANRRYNADAHVYARKPDAGNCPNADSRSNASSACYTTRFYLDADSYTDANCYARPYTNANQNACVHANSDRYAYPYTDADRYAYAHFYACLNTHGGSHSYANSYTRSYLDADANSYSHPCANGYAHSTPDADIHAYANSHNYSRQGRPL